MKKTDALNLKFRMEVENFNNIVLATKERLMEDFCTGEAIPIMKVLRIKKEVEIDLLQLMDVITKEVIKTNFQLMAQSKDNKDGTGGFTTRLMLVFTKRMDAFFEVTMDLLKTVQVATILTGEEYDINSTNRVEQDRIMEAIADTRVKILEEFTCTLAKNIGGLEIAV